MKFTFQDLGPIKRCAIELNNLTVLSGCNNTGKTYLTYALYGFLSRWQQYVPHLKLDFEELSDTGHLEIDLQPMLEKRKSAVDIACKRFVERLSSVLAADSKRFENTKLKIEKLATVDATNIEIAETITTGTHRNLITLSKARGTSVLSIVLASSARKFSPHVFPLVLGPEMSRVLFGDLFPKTFIVSTERTGAVAFRGELNLAKNRLLEAANEVKAHEELNPSQLLARLTSSAYPLPVRDNVDYVNTLSSLQSQESEIASQHPELVEDFADLIGGEYRVDRQGELTFTPQKTRARLRMGESSSAVRSLVILRFYILHVASKGDLLMIDEPELNLHPLNQRKLARLLARLSSLGIKVFITTHSDYIIREFNNLVQLSALGDSGADIRREFGYSPGEGLLASDLSVYMLEEGLVDAGGQRRVRGITINQAEVHPHRSISSTTFDSTIVAMNRLQTALTLASDDI